VKPHELARAQFGRFADRFDLSAATTKAKKVHLIGNSVCPEVAEAVVRANNPDHGHDRPATRHTRPSRDLFTEATA
jgi:DNA (cytosine-5)-methyltransferase 1